VPAFRRRILFAWLNSLLDAAEVHGLEKCIFQAHYRAVESSENVTETSFQTPKPDQRMPIFCHGMACPEIWRHTACTLATCQKIYNSWAQVLVMLGSHCEKACRIIPSSYCTRLSPGLGDSLNMMAKHSHAPMKICSFESRDFLSMHSFLGFFRLAGLRIQLFCGKIWIYYWL